LSIKLMAAWVRIMKNPEVNRTVGVYLLLLTNGVFNNDRS
jgi:hypothetical protein